MTTPPTTPPREPGKSGQPGQAGRSARSTSRWLIPAVTFLVGLGIGMWILGAVRSSSGSISSETPTVTTTVTSTPTGFAGTAGTGGTAVATARVPAECLQVDDDARRLANLSNQALAAARDLDASRLSDIVRQIGEAQSTLSAHADTCRAARTTVTTAPPLSPSATSSTAASTAP